MKENYGDLESLKELEKEKSKSFTIEQLLNNKLKNIDGESREEVTKRIEISFNKILVENIGKRVAIVSHGASIKFLLMKWCKLNDNNDIEYNKKTITVNSPGIIKLVFEEQELVELKQIY